MAKDIAPEKQTVLNCLRGKTYYVDFYQREYVWKTDTVKVLLDDICYNFMLSYEHHKTEELSQKVIDLYNWYFLNVFITNTVDGKCYIVDGQQRLSTLTLIATKLYHMSPEGNLKKALEECICANDLFSGRIFCIDNAKRAAVMKCLIEGIPYTEPYKNETERTLVERYSDIDKYINDLQMTDHQRDAFVAYFLNKLVLVELSIDKDDTPMIFEVINDRGEALKPFEILKGKLVGKLGKTETDKYSELWDKALKQLPNKEDEFISSFLKSQYVFKRDSKMETELNNSYHRFIFSENTVAESLKFRNTDIDHESRIKNFISHRLRYYSALYATLLKNEDVFLEYDNVVNGLTGQYENAMAACSIDDLEQQVKVSTIAKEVDRLWVLLQMNGVYDSNQFQTISYKLNELLKDATVADYRKLFNQLIENAIRQKKGLQMGTSVALLDKQTFLRKDYTNSPARFLRYFFARIEKYLCDQTNCKMQNSVKYVSTSTGAKTGYHIEHILSHNDTNEGYFSSVDEFEQKRNQLGGLLLLKGHDNISSGNEEYADKLKTYSSGFVWGHSLCEEFYHTNKDFNAFNDDLLKKTGVNFRPIDKFDKEALDYRNELLYQLVKIIWEC